jgi:hypothetical protein
MTSFCPWREGCVLYIVGLNFRGLMISSSRNRGRQARLNAVCSRQGWLEVKIAMRSLNASRMQSMHKSRMDLAGSASFFLSESYGILSFINQHQSPCLLPNMPQVSDRRWAHDEIRSNQMGIFHNVCQRTIHESRRVRCTVFAPRNKNQIAEVKKDSRIRW